jgi:type IX secretion system substrate protein
MKSTKFITLLSILLSINLSAQTTLIPDAIFEQKLINQGYDTGLINGSVPTANIDTITSFGVVGAPGDYIYDLTGIEDFTSLIRLNCGNNKIDTLDLSQNTNLVYLYADWNNLTYINLTQNILLEILEIHRNLLPSLDITNNINLKRFTCQQFNQLTTLDLTQNTALRYVDLSENPLPTVDLSQNLMLDTFIFDQANQLVSLDVTQNTALKQIDIEVSALSFLDLSQNVSLEDLYLRSTQLTSVDVRNCVNLNRIDLVTNNLLECVNIKNGSSNSTYTRFVINPLLGCIQVDDSSTFSPNSFVNNPNAFWSDNCPSPCSFVGIDDIERSKQTVSIYPNPSSTSILIDTRLDIDRLTMSDISGKLIKSYIPKSNNVNVSDLPNGVYLLKIETKEGVLTKKFVKQ